MKILLHDLEPARIREMLPDAAIPTDLRIIEQRDSPIHKCVGCFGCWLKTPGSCIIQDGYGEFGGWIGKCTDYIILSRIVYGGFSPFIKNVLDRNIGFFLPFFELRNGEMHHLTRHPGHIRFSVFGYGENSEEEKQTFRLLVKANGMNLSSGFTQALLAKTPAQIAHLQEWKEVLV